MPNAGRTIFTVIILFILVGIINIQAPAEEWDVYADTWVATDATGRSLPTAEVAGPPRAERSVGAFYFLWLNQDHGPGPFNISRILAKNPAAIEDRDHPEWGPIGAFHYWGEPIFGYYLNHDPWVLRKHAQMLRDAGVDTVVFDCTNHWTYPDSYRAMFRTWKAMREEGNATPQIAFLCPFGGDPASVADNLYRQLYRRDKAWVSGTPGFTVEHSGNLVRIPARDENIFVRSPDRLRLPSGIYHNITIALRNPGNIPQIRIQWHNMATQTWLPENGIVLPLENSNEVQEITLDALGKPGWESLVRQVRIEVPAGGALDIERVAILPDDPGPTLPGDVYDWRFVDNDWEDLFFQWEGKPLLLVNKAAISDPEILEYFTFRTPMGDYADGPSGPDQWSWLEIYPQHIWRNSEGEAEQMAVGIGQNARDMPDGSIHTPSGFQEPDTRGRSFYKGTPPEGDGLQLGFNFQQQWDHAIKADPKFIWITSWNEWVAQRGTEFNSVEDPVVFVDDFTEEKSRDAEPVKDLSIRDNYYYQMIANIRRYKGVRAVPAAPEPYAITIDGAFGEWQTVQPEYRDTIGDTVHRDFPGWGEAGPYVNTSGRNDIIVAKAASNENQVAFYARTRVPLTQPSQDAWMLLLIDIDQNHATGWEGYDYLVSQNVLMRNLGGYNWLTAATDVEFKFEGNEIEIAVPRELLPELNDPVTFDFKWADNFQEADIMDLSVHGDTAPNDRYNYRYVLKP